MSTSVTASASWQMEVYPVCSAPSLYPTNEQTTHVCPQTGKQYSQTHQVEPSPLTIYYFDETAPNRSLLENQTDESDSSPPDWWEFLSSNGLEMGDSGKTDDEVDSSANTTASSTPRTSRISMSRDKSWQCYTKGNTTSAASDTTSSLRCSTTTLSFSGSRNSEQAENIFGLFDVCRRNVKYNSMTSGHRCTDSSLSLNSHQITQSGLICPRQSYTYNEAQRPPSYNRLINQTSSYNITYTACPALPPNKVNLLYNSKQAGVCSSRNPSFQSSATSTISPPLTPAGAAGLRVGEKEVEQIGKVYEECVQITDKTNLNSSPFMNRQASEICIEGSNLRHISNRVKAARIPRLPNPLPPITSTSADLPPTPFFRGFNTSSYNYLPMHNTLTNCQPLLYSQQVLLSQDCLKTSPLSHTMQRTGDVSLSKSPVLFSQTVGCGVCPPSCPPKIEHMETSDCTTLSHCSTDEKASSVSRSSFYYLSQHNPYHGHMCSDLYTGGMVKGLDVITSSGMARGGGDLQPTLVVYKSFDSLHGHIVYNQPRPKYFLDKIRSKPRFYF